MKEVSLVTLPLFKDWLSTSSAKQLLKDTAGDDNIFYHQLFDGIEHLDFSSDDIAKRVVSFIYADASDGHGFVINIIEQLSKY